MTQTKDGDAARLLDFLQERDAPCPLCGYNLRNLTVGVCPECRHELRLSVGLHHVRFGWFLIAVAPGIFSGIAAVLIAALLLFAESRGGDPAPGIYLIVMFGFASGVATLGLILWRNRYVQLRPPLQRLWAMAAWGVHAMAFFGVLLLFVLTA